MTKILGIDDAGRGPVLGPMVLAGVLIDKKDEIELIRLDVKDSKKVFPRKRKRIAKQIQEKFPHHIELAFPDEINKMMTSGTNLNTLEALKASMIINKLMQNQKEKIKVVIDCPSVNTKSWHDQLSDFIIKKDLVDLACEHKADEHHLAVGAASIIAKVRRDEEIQKIKQRINITIGSGYPSDPLTKAFLHQHGEHFVDKNIIRTEWATWKNIIKGKTQKSLF